MSIPRILFYKNNKFVLQDNDPLGRGAFGEVWKATMEPIDKSTPPIEIALKFIKIAPGNANIPELKREAQSMVRLSHSPNCSPYIVCLYDVFTQSSPEGTYVVFAMELANGGDMNTYINSLYGTPAMEGGRGTFQGIPYNEFIRHASHLLRGLVVLKNAGVTHLDIKPENLLGFRSADGTITFKYGDFGLACIFDNRKECTYGGSVSYFSIEYSIARLMGRGSQLSSNELLYEDVYSLGATLFELANFSNYLNLEPTVSKIQQNLPGVPTWRIVAIADVVALLDYNTNAPRNPHSSINNLIESMTRMSTPTFGVDQYRKFWNYVDQLALQGKDIFITLQQRIPSASKLYWYPGQPPFRFTAQQALNYVYQESEECILGITPVNKSQIQEIMREIGIPMSSCAGKIDMCLALRDSVCLVGTPGKKPTVLSNDQLTSLATVMGIVLPPRATTAVICNLVASTVQNQLSATRERVTNLIIGGINALPRGDETQRQQLLTRLKGIRYVQEIGLLDVNALMINMDTWVKLGKNTTIGIAERIANIESALTLSLLFIEWGMPIAPSVEALTNRLMILKKRRQEKV